MYKEFRFFPTIQINNLLKKLKEKSELFFTSEVAMSFLHRLREKKKKSSLRSMLQEAKKPGAY